MAEGHGGVHRRPQSLEDGRPGLPEPAFAVQVIDGHEPSFPPVVADHPVVAPAAYRGVPQGHGADAPSVGQGVSQVSFGHSGGPVLHEASRYGGARPHSQPYYGEAGRAGGGLARQSGNGLWALGLMQRRLYLLSFLPGSGTDFRGKFGRCGRSGAYRGPLLTYQVTFVDRMICCS
jgi:hypothetical protein